MEPRTVSRKNRENIRGGWVGVPGANSKNDIPGHSIEDARILKSMIGQTAR